MPSPGSDVIRDLLIRLGAITEPGTERTMVKFDGMAEQIASTLQSVAVAATKATASIGGMVATGLALATGAARNAASIEAQAKALGVSTDRVQELQFAYGTLIVTQQQLDDSMGKGADTFARLREEAHALGLVTEEETIRATAELSKQWRKMTAVGRKLRIEIGEQIAPAVTDLVRRFNDWIRTNRELISQRLERFVDGTMRAIKLIGPPLAIFTAAVLALAAAFRAVGVAIAIVRFATLSPLLAALALAVGAAVVGVVALALVFEDLIMWVTGGNSVIGENIKHLIRWLPFGDALVEVLTAVAEFGRSAVTAIGRLGAAIAKAFASAVWRRAKDAMQPLIDQFAILQKIVETIDAAISGRLLGFAGQIRQAARLLDAGSQMAAPGIERAAGAERPAAAAVGGMDRSVTSNSSVDNSQQTLNQTNNITGGVQGAETFIQSLWRTARESVAGGVR